MKTDVIIVGAGPTGLSLAAQLIRFGIDFVIIEKNATVTPYSKALGVHARTLEIYDQLGLAEKAVAHGAIAGAVRFLEGGEIRGEIEISKLGQGLSPFPFLLVLEQSKNEQLIYEYLKANAREVLWESELEDLSQSDSGVSATFRTRTGESQVIEGKYLVGCDGAKSPVRHELGLEFEGSTFERMFYVADVRLDWALSHDALHVCLTRSSFVLFFPMEGEERYRIVGIFPEEFSKDEDEVLYEEIEERIKSEAELAVEISDVNWFSVYKVHTRRVNAFSLGRCFLAGDAAHIHSPAGAQGMNTGIQDAYNLGWKLALVVKGHAEERILDSYNEERLENAKRLLETTDRLFQLGAGSDWLVSFIRTTIFPQVAKYILSFDVVKREIFPLISQIGISYRDFNLSRHGDDEDLDVKAGDRMPYFLIDGKSVYDRLREPKFHLIEFGQNDSATRRHEIESSYPGLVDYHFVPLDKNIREIFGTESPFSLFLRPDNYIAAIASSEPNDVAGEYLHEQIGYSHRVASSETGAS